VPIRDAAGRVVAALNVSAPRFRFEGRLDDAARLLVDVAGELSRQLRGELQPA
jgi:IclR family KDG regulon transcriptional repressor